MKRILRRARGRQSLISTAGASILLTALCLFGQTTVGLRPSFEVASIKPNTPDDGFVNMRDQPGGRFIATGVTLKMLMAYAYRLRDYQIIGGPSWLDSDRWAIQAEADPSTFPARTAATFVIKPDAMALRVQSLIEDRFQLKSHHEEREMPLYELVIAKDGAKVQLSSDQTPVQIQEELLASVYSAHLAIGSEIPPPPPLPPAMGAGPPPPPQRGLFRWWRRNDRSMQAFQASAIPLDNLVLFLAQRLNQTVIDKTNLHRLYDVQLEWALDSTAPRNVTDGVGANAPDPNGPSIFAAVQSQLGLRLVSTKGPVEVIIIDSVQKPVN